jgi:hypothetical protein
MIITLIFCGIALICVAGWAWWTLLTEARERNDERNLPRK